VELVGSRAPSADQREMIADQGHRLHEQFKHLHLSVWEKQLGVLLRVATAAMGLSSRRACQSQLQSPGAHVRLEGEPE
jgi:hypothetical protein